MVRAFWKLAASRQTCSLSNTSNAVDEKDLEVAMEVFLNGADMVVEEDRGDREGLV